MCLNLCMILSTCTRKSQIPWSQSYSWSWASQCGYWKSNLGLLPEQQALLTVEPCFFSVDPLLICSWWFSLYMFSLHWIIHRSSYVIFKHLIVFYTKYNFGTQKSLKCSCCSSDLTIYLFTNTCNNNYYILYMNISTYLFVYTAIIIKDAMKELEEVGRRNWSREMV